ncbi:MAG: hypothetical protein K6G63_10485 [Eubacterium sp.]|nr:hypothetical protein [Eubacterium sp.]
MREKIVTLLIVALALSSIYVPGNLKAEQISTIGQSGLNSETPSVESPDASIVPGSATPAVSPIVTPSKRLVVKDKDCYRVAKSTDGKSCEIVAYTGDKNVTTLYLPAKVDGKKVTGIADNTFADCLFLKNLVLASDAEILGDGTFSKNTEIQFWGKSGYKAQKYATEKGLKYHVLQATAKVTAKKNGSWKKAKVTWTGVKGVVSYAIYRKKGKGKYSAIATVKAATYSDAKLGLGAKYTYKVAAKYKAEDDEVIESTVTKTGTHNTKPGKLKKVKAYGVRGGIYVKWARNKAMAGYQVYMKVHVSGFKTNFNRVKTLKKNNITGYRCKMLVRGMKYSYKVRGYCKVGKKKVYGDFVKVTAKAK